MNANRYVFVQGYIYHTRVYPDDTLCQRFEAKEWNICLYGTHAPYVHSYYEFSKDITNYGASG